MTGKLSGHLTVLPPMTGRAEPATMVDEALVLSSLSDPKERGNCGRAEPPELGQGTRNF